MKVKKVNKYFTFYITKSAAVIAAHNCITHFKYFGHENTQIKNYLDDL